MSMGAVRQADIINNTHAEPAPPGRKGIRFLFRNPAAEPFRCGPSHESSSG